MGWMWASAPSAATPTAAPTQGGSSSAADNKGAAPAPAQQAQAAATNDYGGDAEIAKFMAQVQAEFGAKPSEPAPQPAAPP